MSNPSGRLPHWSESHVWVPDLPEEDTAPQVEALDELDTTGWHASPDEAAALLSEQRCPVCGEGPWKSPLNHVSRKHGIDRFTMRDVCGLTTNDRVVDPALSQRFREVSVGRDMTAVNAAAATRRKPRRTREGLRRNVAAIEAFNETPEAPLSRVKAAGASKAARAKERWRTSMAEHWESLSDAERAAHGAKTGGDAAHMQRMREAVVLQGCGTVAAYKRGCRCVDCREAKRASRR